MPAYSYRRRRYRGKSAYGGYARRYGGKSSYRKGSGWHSTAASKSIVRWGSKSGSELKYADFKLESAAGVDWNPYGNANAIAICLNSGLAAGSTTSSREGNHINLQDLRLNYFTKGGTAPCLVRVLVIVDKSPNGVKWTNDTGAAVTDATARAAGLLGNVLTNYTGSTAIQQTQTPVKPENSFRYMIKYDMTHMVTATTADLNVVPHSIVIPLRTQAVYVGSTGTADSDALSKGAVWLCLMTSETTAAASCKVGGCARLTWKD